MNSHLAIDILRKTFVETFWLSLPLLTVGFLAGIVISLVQIVTSIQDSSFGALPRLGAFLVGIVLFLPWMVNRIIVFTVDLLGDLGRYAR